MIYLDNAATTKVAPEVIEAISSFMKKNYGNPSSKYYNQAEDAKRILQKSRRNIADFINAEEDEIIFTSGSTESNNFILKGLWEKTSKNHIITTKVEHKSILKTCDYLEEKDCDITYLDVNKHGMIDIEELKNAINDDTFLVSIIWANNELGTLNNIDKISQICENKDLFFHTDATQVLGKKKIDLNKQKIDFMSFTAHKIHGPKGIGAVYIKNDDIGFKPDMEPLIHGGNQEDDFRAGTQSMHNIVGFSKAIELYKDNFNSYLNKVVKLEEMLINKLKMSFDNIIFNSDLDNKIPGIISLSIPNLENEVFLSMVKEDIAISTGSACNITAPSYVLKEIGGKDKQYNTLRVSISHYNNDEILKLVDFLEKYIEKYSF